MATPDSYGVVAAPHGAQPYVPRSRKRTKAGRYSHEITYEELSQYFHLPTEKACQRLGVGLTILKRICRRFGLPRWPYKKPIKTAFGHRHLERSAEPQGTGYTPPGYSPTTAAERFQPHQSYASPSPFAEYPTPWDTNHQQKEQWSHQPAVVHRSLDGCSRPIPRRIAPQQPGERSIMDATLRALGVSTDTHATMPSSEAQTDRLDMLISAINQSESEKEENLPIPDSPASVNTMRDTSPEDSARLAAPLRNSPFNVQSAAPVPIHAPVAPAVAPAAAALSEALTQLANNGDGDKSAAVMTLVDVLASNPALAQQLAHLLEPNRQADQPDQQRLGAAMERPISPTSAAVAAATSMHAQFQERQNLYHQQQQHQQQQQATVADRMRMLQQFQQQVRPLMNGAESTEAATALRRAELSAKFQALQAKMAARQALLQRLQNHMAMQSAVQQSTHAQEPAMMSAPLPGAGQGLSMDLLQMLGVKVGQQV